MVANMFLWMCEVTRHTRTAQASGHKAFYEEPLTCPSPSSHCCSVDITDSSFARNSHCRDTKFRLCLTKVANDNKLYSGGVN